jgi:hypothetical protein
MNNIRFINKPELFNPKLAFVIHLRGIENEENLLQELSSKLEFPIYFGYNWNAVFDCLRDFHWIKQKKVILIHDDFPLLDEKTLGLYLQILLDAANDWEKTDKHCLEIIFPKSAEKLLYKYLNTI